MNDKNKNLENTNNSLRNGNAAFQELKAGQSEHFKELVRQHRLGHESIKDQIQDVNERRAIIDQKVEGALADQNLIFKDTLGDETNPVYREATDRARQLLGEQAKLDTDSQELQSNLLHPIGNYEKPQTLSWDEAMALYRQVRAEGDEIDTEEEVEGDVTMLDVLHDVDDFERARAIEWRKTEGRRRHQEEDSLKTASEDVLLYMAINPDVTVTGREIGLEIYNFRDDVGKNPDRRDAAARAGKLVASLMSAGRGDQIKQAKKLYDEHGLYLQVGKRQFIRDGKIINRAGLNVYRAVTNREVLPTLSDTDTGRIIYRDVLMDVKLMGEAEYDRGGKQQVEVPSVTEPATEEQLEIKDGNHEWESEFSDDVARVIEQMRNDYIFEQDYLSGGSIRAMSSIDMGTRRTRDALTKAKHMKESESKKDGMTREQRVVAALISRWPVLSLARGKDNYNSALTIIRKAISDNLQDMKVA